MRTKWFGTALALVACAMLTPAFAGSKGGGGYGGGGGWKNSNKNWNSSSSKSWSSASNNTNIIFKNSMDWGGAFNGAANLIGAFNPAPGPSFRFVGGNTYVQIVFGGMPGPGLPDLKGPGVITTQPPYGSTDHRPICEDGQPYRRDCRVR